MPVYTELNILDITTTDDAEVLTAFGNVGSSSTSCCDFDTPGEFVTPGA